MDACKSIGSDRPRQQRSEQSRPARLIRLRLDAVRILGPAARTLTALLATGRTTFKSKHRIYADHGITQRTGKRDMSRLKAAGYVVGRPTPGKLTETITLANEAIVPPSSSGKQPDFILVDAGAMVATPWGVLLVEGLIDSQLRRRRSTRVSITAAAIGQAIGVSEKTARKWIGQAVDDGRVVTSGGKSQDSHGRWIQHQNRYELPSSPSGTSGPSPGGKSGPAYLGVSNIQDSQHHQAVAQSANTVEESSGDDVKIFDSKTNSRKSETTSTPSRPSTSAPTRKTRRAPLPHIERADLFDGTRLHRLFVILANAGTLPDDDGAEKRLFRLAAHVLARGRAGAVRNLPALFRVLLDKAIIDGKWDGTDGSDVDGERWYVRVKRERERAFARDPEPVNRAFHHESAGAAVQTPRFRKSTPALDPQSLSGYQSDPTDTEPNRPPTGLTGPHTAPPRNDPMTLEQQARRQREILADLARLG